MAARMTLPQRLLVITACALLPRSQRLRYRAEFVADLVSLASGERTRYAVSLLRAAPALRSALRASDHRPLTCRIGAHRNHLVQLNPEDQRVRGRECLRCGRIKDVKYYEKKGNIDEMAYGTMYFSSGP